MRYRTWTQSQDDLLLKLKGDGKTWGEIGRKLDATSETCKYRFQKYLDTNSRHVKKRHIVREEPDSIILKFDKRIKLDVTYEDDPRADKRPPVFTVDGKSYWSEKRSRARGDFDWGLNPVMPKL